MQNLWNSSLGSDITVIFRNGEKIRAHSAFLASKSSVFMDLFTEFSNVDELNMLYIETLMCLYEFPVICDAEMGQFQIGDRKIGLEIFADILTELDKYDGIKHIKHTLVSFFKKKKSIDHMIKTKIPVNQWVHFGYQPPPFRKRIQLSFFDLEAMCILNKKTEIEYFMRYLVLDIYVQKFIDILQKYPKFLKTLSYPNQVKNFKLLVFICQNFTKPPTCFTLA